MSLIALHEIGHHALGHFHLLKELDLPLRLNETPSATDSPQYRHARQFHWLELEADRFAFTHLMDLTARNETAFATQKVPENLHPHLLSLMGLAYSLIILCLHANDRPISWHGRRSHPHAAVRLMASVHQLIPIAIERGVVDVFQKSIRMSFQILAYAPEMHKTGIYLGNHKRALSRIVAQMDRFKESDFRLRAPRFDFQTGRWEKRTIK
jgi:hypothetical protein